MINKTPRLTIQEAQALAIKLKREISMSRTIGELVKSLPVRVELPYEMDKTAKKLREWLENQKILGPYNQLDFDLAIAPLVVTMKDKWRELTEPKS